MTLWVQASFHKVVRPMIFFLSLMLLVWGAFRLMVTVFIRVIVIVRYKGCGIWVLTALWGTLFQLAISSFSWMDAAIEGVGERVGQMMETEADREPDKEKPKRRALSMEDLRRKYSWWPSGSSKEGQPAALVDMEAGEGEGIALRSASRAPSCSNVIKMTMTLQKGSVRELVGWVRNVVLMNVYLDLRNPGGSGFWVGGI